MEDVNSITSNFQEFKNIKDFNIKIGDINYIFSISESNTDINFVITQKERNDPFEYGEHYSLDKLIKINDIFKMFNSINAVRKSFESLLISKKYTFEKNDDNIIFTLKINIFEEITDVSFILNKKKLSKEEIEKIMNRQINEIKELKNEIENLKIKHDKEIKEIKEQNDIEIKELYKEIKELKDQNDKKIKELYTEIEEIKKQSIELIKSNKKKENEYSFSFRKGTNYTISNNGKTAEKTKGGIGWNCTIIGDTEIPKYKKCKWRIKLKKFKIDKNINTVNTFIGIGPNNPQNKICFYGYCWSLSCGEPKILSNKKDIFFNNYPGNLKEGDIIEVIVDMTKGTLSFKINNIDYGLTCSDIPANKELYPIVLIHDMNQIVEILD